MMVSRCMEFCPATPACNLDYFASPCMCTTTSTTTFQQQLEEREGAAGRGGERRQTAQR